MNPGAMKYFVPDGTLWLSAFFTVAGCYGDPVILVGKGA